jgi:hypothetical protein
MRLIAAGRKSNTHRVALKTIWKSIQKEDAPCRKNSRTGRKADASGQRIDAALNQAAMDAVEAHKKAGQPLVVWQDGHTTLISSDDVQRAENGRRTSRGRKKST